jgi:hypothetical protein
MYQLSDLLSQFEILMYAGNMLVVHACEQLSYPKVPIIRVSTAVCSISWHLASPKSATCMYQKDSINRLKASESGDPTMPFGFDDLPWARSCNPGGCWLP